jgi:hypothetical protein
LYSINPKVDMTVSQNAGARIFLEVSRKRREWVVRSRQGGAGQGWNLMMERMKFIVLDTRREGRLKLNRRSHIGVIAARFLNRKGQARPGACPCFRQDDSIIQLKANGSPDGFSLNIHF